MRRSVIASCLTLVVAATAAVARADLRTQPIEYRDGPTVLRGYLAYDDATDNVRPGVLVCPEWWGLTDYPKHRAEQLARMGYVAFVPDMYGDGKATSDPVQAKAMASPLSTDRMAMRRRAQAGLDVLVNQKWVDKARVVAIGYCFGGTVALELARAGAALAGVVTFHGDLSRTSDEGPDHIGCKVLVCHGGADTLVPPPVLAAFEQEMIQAGVNYEINIYGGAKHAFTNPAADGYHMPPVGYNAQADRRSWAAAQDFFAEVFKQM